MTEAVSIYERTKYLRLLRYARKEHQNLNSNTQCKMRLSLRGSGTTKAVSMNKRTKCKRLLRNARNDISKL